MDQPLTLQEVTSEDYLTQTTIQNPHASAPLVVSVLAMRNTPLTQIEENVRANSARDELEWLSAHEAHDGRAVIVGGGPSVADHVEDIRKAKAEGATVFALNAASRWLRGHGIEADYQVIVDAQPSTAGLVDLEAKAHLFASQVRPEVMDLAPKPVVWHLGNADPEETEALFPGHRRRRGGYVLLGGGASVGTCALCVCFALGFRSFDLYGYDSSLRDGATHAYPQPQNATIPVVDVPWGERVYRAPVPMKAQAEWFMILARTLKQHGCALRVCGDGLLPAMFNTPPECLTERDKYRILWGMDIYRATSPGELDADLFLEVAKPDGLVIDFGCGTGRAGLRLHEAGVPVFLIDFADNCRDGAAQTLPFLCADLTRDELPVRGAVGLCTDVMEHIPAKDTDAALRTMFTACPRVFFSIGTGADGCGVLIGQELHINIRAHAEWRAILQRYGRVTFEEERDGQSLFFVEQTC